MANYYVYHGGSNTAPYDTWAKAANLLSTAAAASAAGEPIYVAHDHAEVSAGVVSLVFPGTAVAPNRILCVNQGGAVPPVSADLRTTATVSTTGANAITFTGHFYCYGLIYQANSLGAGGGSSINFAVATNNQQRFDSCVFRCLSIAAAASAISTGTGQTVLYWNNCSIKYASIGNTITMGRSRFVWTNSPNAFDPTGVAPTTMFVNPSGASYFTFEAVDFNLMSGKTFFSNALMVPMDAVFKDCKFPASVTMNGVLGGGIGQLDIKVIRCDSGASNYRNERHNFAGDLTTETTVVRTGGATDGTQAVSHKIITLSGARWADPFTGLPLTIWNDTVGSSVTATVYGTWATGAAVPKKEDIWIDVEYLGSAASPQGSFATSGNADILASANCNSDGSTWGGTPAGGGTATPFKMAVTITPQMKGPLTVYVRCARASTNAFYIDPKVVLS